MLKLKNRRYIVLLLTMVGVVIAASIARFFPIQASSFAISGSVTAENTGVFLDFDNYNSNVRVNLNQNYFTGYAFSEDLGWVAFGALDNPNGAVTFDPNTGVLQGKAHVMSTGGYLDFDNYNSAVVIDLDTGALAGYVFSEDIGWLNFNTPGVIIADYNTDSTEPSTNASNIEMFSELAGYQVPDSSWVNVSEPLFTWDAGADNPGGSGLKGYCLYLGSDPDVDPGNHITESGGSGLLINSPISVVGTDCMFITSATSLDLSSASYLSSAFETGESYYLNIKAIDNAGNTYNTASASFSFSFDQVNPTNVTFISPAAGVFNNISEISFSWPITGGSASNDADSGVAGWQYSINSSEDWSGPDQDPISGINYIDNDGSTNSYSFSADVDGPYFIIGNNIIYFRTVDVAGNYSTFITGSVSYGGEAPTFPSEGALTVTPTTNSSNSFGLSWPEAIPGDSHTVAAYYYMINREPPTTLSTILSNSLIYIHTTSTEVPTSQLVGSIRGTNTVCVVAVDEANNYSPSNKLCSEYLLDSENPDPPNDLFITDSSVRANELWRATLTWQVPTYTGNGDLTYLIERSTDNATWVEINTTKGLAYTDIVEESMLYYYRVASYDTSNQSINNPSYAASVSITPKGSYDQPAELISGPKLTTLTTRKATIIWSTGRESDSRIQYGLSSGEYFEEEPSKGAQTRDHEINLINLLPGTQYFYRAKWTDEDGNIGLSPEETFTTLPAPTVTDPKVASVGLNSASIDYTVTGASRVKIYYGKTTSFGGASEIQTSQLASRYLTLLDQLDDGTQYFYKINTFDEEGFEYDGNTLSFVTIARPRISNLRIQQVKNASQPTAVITWDSNTEISSIISYFPVTIPEELKSDINVDLVTEGHRMIIRDLKPQIQYNVQVSGVDRFGNEALSDSLLFTTATDTRPPAIDTIKVESSIVTSSGGDRTAQLIVSWNTDEDATSQVEYGEGSGSNYSQRTIENSKLATNHLVVISGLEHSSIYHLRVISTDDAGNESVSVDTVALTPKASNSAFELVILNLREVFGFL